AALPAAGKRAGPAKTGIVARSQPAQTGIPRTLIACCALHFLDTSEAFLYPLARSQTREVTRAHHCRAAAFFRGTFDTLGNPGRANQNSGLHSPAARRSLALVHEKVTDPRKSFSNHICRSGRWIRPFFSARSFLCNRGCLLTPSAEYDLSAHRDSLRHAEERFCAADGHLDR